MDQPPHIELSMKSNDETTVVRLVGNEQKQLPSSSCFESMEQASTFFKTGSLGFSASRDPTRSDGLLLQTDQWIIGPLAVSEVQSSYFEDGRKFPQGTITFDHALIMRDIAHEWHRAEDMSHEA